MVEGTYQQSEYHHFMGLSDTAIRSAKGGERPRKMTDGGGLYLLVTPSGSRHWRMQYRFAGKQKLLAFGSYPAVSLADARRKRDEARNHLANGIDPSVQKRLDKVTKLVGNANTFRVVAKEFTEKLEREKRSAATLKKVNWLLDFAYPVIGDRPIHEISAAEVLVALRQVEARGRHESARRLRSTIGSVFRYAIATARAENDPTIALQGALTTPTVTSRPAVTDPKVLAGMLRAIDTYMGQPTTHAALRLMAILFPRPDELRAAEWTEFDLVERV